MKKNIVHKKIFKKERYKGKDNVYSIRYLCNQATGTTKNKYDYFWINVNCKNCLKQKPKPNKKRDTSVLSGWRLKLFNRLLDDGLIRVEDNKLEVTDKFMNQINKEMKRRRRNG